MRILHSVLTLVGLAVVAFPQSAKADIWLYQVISTDPNFSFNVEFQLPTFVQDVVQQTVFNTITTDGGPATAFSISGGSGGCSATDFVRHNSASSVAGPCWAIVGPAFAAVVSSDFTPAFDGPGTFTKETTTVKITDLASVPEPASWTLLSIAAAGAWLLSRRRRLAAPNQT
jgi:hypothetical protein